MSIYERQDLIPPSFFQKAFKIFPKANFIIELQNLLAENEENILSINLNDAEKIRAKYKVKKDNFKIEREILLDTYISSCLWDNRLSNDERMRLSFLCRLLDLNEEYLQRRIAEEGRAIYRNKVQYVILDNKITDAERNELKALRNDFNISDQEGKEIYSEESKEKIQSYVDKIVSNRRMSPEDEKTLGEMISGLNVNVTYTDNGLSKLKKFWEIENGDLIAVTSPINLQKSENLYYSTKIEWYETRKKTTYVSYAGVTQRFRIAKGLSLCAGMIAPSRHTEEYMKHIDTGDIVLTNKRIIFMGKCGNKTIPFSKVLAITPFSNGIEIDKETGKKPFFKCSDPEVMGLYITRLLRDF